MNKAPWRSKLSWSIYDWANSVFATTVIAGFFPIFFKQFWSAGADVVVSTARLGLANSLAGLAVALFAPLLGAITDQVSLKKRFLLFFTLLGVLMTAALFCIERGAWQTAVGVYVLASIGFSGAIIFYDALLTSVARKDEMDMVSSLGFSLGYLGGGVLFAVNVWMTLNPGLFGFVDTTQSVRFSFLTVALWWAVFSLPLFFFVNEEGKASNAKESSWSSAIKRGLTRLKTTYHDIRTIKPIALFLLAYFFYMDGVGTVIRMAVDYGMSIGFQSADLIKALLLIQFIGFPAALGFAWIARTISARRCILFAIGVYLFITVWGATMSSVKEFYFLAILVGLVQGGLQALSRSYFGALIPEHRSGEFFGFYNMVGRFSTVLGPVLMGGVGLCLHALGLGTELATRASILSISVLFFLGGECLKLVIQNLKNLTKDSFKDDLLIRFGRLSKNL